MQHYMMLLVEVLQKSQKERSAVYEQLLSAPEKNPTQKFFESMADIVSKFPPHLIAETRLKVCQVVTEMELKMLATSSSIDDTGPSTSAQTYLVPTPMPSDDSNTWTFL